MSPPDAPRGNADSGPGSNLKELLATYPDAQGRFDELFEAPFTPRPHWSRVLSLLSATSAADVRERLSAAER